MTDIDIMAFQAVMLHGNMTKAAASLFISQPALSTRIAGLEAELGCRLFLRRRGIKNIELTEKGKQFIPLAEQWDSVRTGIRSLSTSTEVPPIRISSLNSISSAILPRVFELFVQGQPNLSLQVEDLDSYSSYDAVESRRIDLAVIVDQRYSLKAICKPLFSDPLLFVCNASSNLPENIHPKDLNPKNEIYSPWSLEFEQWHNSWFGKDFKPKLQIQNMIHLAYFLKRSDSWSIVPATVTQIQLDKHSLSIRKLKSQPPDRKVCYLAPDIEESPQIKEFLKYLTLVLEEYERKGILSLAK